MSPREIEHTVTLTVTTKDRDEWLHAWNFLSQAANNLNENVVVSSHEVPTDEEIQNQRHYFETDIYYDENTVLKVYLALMEMGLDSEKTTEIIQTLQNNGILFRERLLRPAL